MQLELGKRYRCRNGCIIRVETIKVSGVAHCSVNNGQDHAMMFNAETGVAHGISSGSYDVIGPAESELYFRLKVQYGKEENVSESKLIRHANRLYEEAQAIGNESEAKAKFILAAAALRMIEQAKAMPPSKPLPPHIVKEIDRMCQPPEKPSKAEADRAASDLLTLMRDDLGITPEVSATLFRLWLVERWDRVAKLAHKIHDGAKT